jgi:pyridoxine 4-dehydrogenase
MPLLAVRPQWPQSTGSLTGAGADGGGHGSRAGRVDDWGVGNALILDGSPQAIQPTMAHSIPPLFPPPGIGVGTWAWGNQLLWGYDPAHDQELQATFARAVELGLRWFDTADSYGTGRLNGRSEALLGRFCTELSPPQRQAVCVATKLAPFPWRLGRNGLGRAFAASRARLQGKLDRVQLHWSTARYAPWQEGPLLEGLADLVCSGQVAELGVSNVGPVRLRRMHAQLARRGVRLSSVQVQLSLLCPAPLEAGGVAEVCRELDIALIAYSPLALGLLARQVDQEPPRGPRGALFRRLSPQLEPLIAAMEAMARPRGASLAGVALNWCRAHGAMPIPGLRRRSQAEVAAQALGWQLEGAERHELDRLARGLTRRMPANPFCSA